jgi:transcriptional regulator with XRE-family HTH domain
MDLRQLREAHRLTRQAIAEALDISLGDIAKMEARMDMSLGSMREFVEAMGGRLEVVARFPDHSVRITGFEGVGEVGS